MFCIPYVDPCFFFLRSILVVCSLFYRARQLSLMAVLSKFLYVRRPGNPDGPPNMCNIRTGDVHFWLNRCGDIIDPTPLDGSHPTGESVYIPWQTVPVSALPKANGEPATTDMCWQNVANIMHLYPGATIVCGTLAKRVAPGVLLALYG